jgi:pyrroline-5-carboxylate reductase
VRIGEPVLERRELLVSRHGVRTTDRNREAVGDAEIVVLAIKPQHAYEAFVDLRGQFAPGQLVLSIIAGVTLSCLTSELGHEAVVRVMPNTPAQIGEGMSVWTATPAVSELGRSQVRAILQSLGREVFVADEKYLDMATALSGSGPGYVFLFLEAMVDAGVHLGFPRKVAEELVFQTVLGSTRMARESGRHLAELRNLVTSPAGTTAAGLQELEDGRLRAVVDQAVMAAYERCQELGGKKKG